jgi:hypothetical protein
MAAGLLIYLLFCMLVGFLGRDRKFGYWGYFFASVLLTPLLGFILVLGSDREKPVCPPQNTRR